MVRLEGFTVRYGTHTAVDAVSLNVRHGELFGLLGPNGSGKSTLLGALATLLPTAEGRAAVDGLDLSSEPAAVRRRLGVVFQYPSLDDKLSVLENLRFQGHLYGLSGAALKRRADELLQRFALTERRGQRVEQLSGGLRRRLELAKALLHRPAVLLLDEPSTGLDHAARQDFWRLIADLRQRDRLTIVVATHLMDEAERCDRVALLDEGRLIALDPPAAMKAALGKAVVTLETADPQALVERLHKERGVAAQVQDHAVQLEGSAGAEAAHRLMDAYPDAVLAVRIGRPTLGDVFLTRTGHAFDSVTEDSMEVPA